MRHAKQTANVSFMENFEHVINLVTTAFKKNLIVCVAEINGTQWCEADFKETLYFTFTLKLIENEI